MQRVFVPSRQYLDRLPSIKLSEAMRKYLPIADAVRTIEGITGRKFDADPKILLENPYPAEFASGVSFGKEYVFLGEIFQFRTHELMHVHDSYMGYMSCNQYDYVYSDREFGFFGNIRAALVSAVLDGRATFVTRIVSRTPDRSILPRFKAIVKIWKDSKKQGLNPFIATACVLYAYVEKALFTISERIRSPEHAFRMVTDNPPTWFAVFFPTWHYRKEIREFLKTNGTEANTATV